MALGMGLLALTSATILPGLSDNAAIATSHGQIEAEAPIIAHSPALVYAPVARPHMRQPQQEATMMPTPVPPPTPVFILPEIPTLLEIPAIRVKAKVQPVGPGKTVSNLGLEWQSPRNRNIGWHNYSRQLGQSGNMVMNGHNNIYGSIFRKLYTLKAGDLITVSSPSYWRTYVVSDVLIVKERGEPYEVLQANAAYISPMVTEDRLTLVSCWPETSNTHRVIVLAKPVGQSY